MEHLPDHHRTGSAGTFPGHPGDLPARRGHLFFSPSLRPRRGSWSPAFRSRVRVRAAGTGVSRTPGVPLARTHRQQAGGPGGAALDAGTVRIDWTLVRVRGEGLRRTDPKTSHSRRVLTLPSWAVDMLRRRYKAAMAENRGLASPVFPDVNGNLRDPSNTRRALREARGSERFGWVTSHVFRKTAATIMDEAGLSARQIADHLGHSRPSITQDTYMGRGVSSPDAAAALEDIV